MTPQNIFVKYLHWFNISDSNLKYVIIFSITKKIISRPQIRITESAVRMDVFYNTSDPWDVCKETDYFKLIIYVLLYGVVKFQEFKLIVTCQGVNQGRF